MKQTDAVRRMTKKVLGRSQHDEGYTLVEMIVAAIILAVLTAMVAVFLINQMRASANSTSRAKQESGASDVLDRTARDISVSDPLLWASPSGLITKTQKDGGAFTLTRYEYAVIAGEGAIYQQKVESTSLTAAQKTSPLTYSWPAFSPLGTDTRDMPTGVLIRRVTVPANSTVFRYYDRNGALVGVPAGSIGTISSRGAGLPTLGYKYNATPGTGDISRVDISLNASSSGGKIALGTSAALRSATAGQSAGVIGSGSTGTLVCPVVSIDTNNRLVFGSVATAVSYQVRWTNSARVSQTALIPARNAPAADTATYPTGGYTYTNSALNGQPLAPGIGYQVIAQDATGTSSMGCLPVYVTTQVGVPTVTADVDPLGGSGTGRTVTNWNSNSPSTYATWPAVTGATGYHITVTATHATNGTTSVSKDVPDSTLRYTYPNPAAWDTRYNYCVSAYASTGGLGAERCSTVLMYPAPVTAAAAKATDYNQNVITWVKPAGSTATSFEVYKLANGTNATSAEINSGSRVTCAEGSLTSNSLVCTEKNVPLDSQFTYYVVVRNGTGNSPAVVATPTTPVTTNSGERRVQQFPSTPQMITPASWLCNGTTSASCNFGGSNRVMWSASPSATRYGLYSTSTSDTSTVSAVDGKSGKVGGSDSITSTVYSQTGQAAATQKYYAAVAWNATGPSPNLRGNQVSGSIDKHQTLNDVVKTIATGGGAKSSTVASAVTQGPTASMTAPTGSPHTFYPAKKTCGLGTKASPFYDCTPASYIDYYTYSYTFSGSVDANSSTATFCSKTPWTTMNYGGTSNGCGFLVKNDQGYSKWFSYSDTKSGSINYTTASTKPTSWTVTAYNPGGVSGGKVQTAPADYDFPDFTPAEDGDTRARGCERVVTNGRIPAAVLDDSVGDMANVCPSGYKVNTWGSAAVTGFKLVPNTTSAPLVTVQRNPGRDAPGGGTALLSYKNGAGTDWLIQPDYVGSNRTYTYRVTVSDANGGNAKYRDYTLRVRPSVPLGVGAEYMANNVKSAPANSTDGRWRTYMKWNLLPSDGGEGIGLTNHMRAELFNAADRDGNGKKNYDNPYFLPNSPDVYYVWGVKPFDNIEPIGEGLGYYSPANVANEGEDYFLYLDNFNRPHDGVWGQTTGGYIRLGQTSDVPGQTSFSRSEIPNSKRQVTDPDGVHWSHPLQGGSNAWWVWSGR